MVISLIEKSTLFPSFFGIILLTKRSTLFPRTFFDVISLVEIPTVLLLTLFDIILMVQKSTLFAHTFFDKISMGKNLTSFLVSCKLMKTFEESFVNNFKKLTFARFFCFLNKSLWRSPVLLKFESCNLQHCKKNRHKLVFWVLTEHLHNQTIFDGYITMKLIL